MKIFSQEWADAFAAVLNHNTVYQEASRSWEEGSIALVLDTTAQAVWLDLLHGRCLEARAVDAAQAHTLATFVIAADEATWKEVLAGHMQPLMGIMRGRLKLAKGSMARLMPYTRAATELVKSAQHIAAEF
jgi:putative sterol carrier protein